MALSLNDVFPKSGGGTKINYQSRSQYEEAVASGLAQDIAVVLSGRSGYGKTCIQERLIYTNRWNHVNVQCLNEYNYAHLVNEIYEELFKKKWGLLSWLLSYVRRSKTPEIAGNAKLDEASIRDIEKRIANISAKSNILICIEKAEKLNSKTKISLVDFINRLPEELTAGPLPKVLIMSIEKLGSPLGSDQKDRFRKVEIGKFTDIEMRELIIGGLRRLSKSLSIDEFALAEAISACRGSPLACSELMRQVLNTANVVDIYGAIKSLQSEFTIRHTAVRNAAKHLSQGVYIPDSWSQALSDRIGDKYELLRIIIDTGRDGSIDDIRQKTSRFSSLGKNIMKVLHEVSNDSYVGEYCCLVIALNEYSFNEPFLFERIQEFN